MPSSSFSNSKVRFTYYVSNTVAYRWFLLIILATVMFIFSSLSNSALLILNNGEDKISGVKSINITNRTDNNDSKQPHVNITLRGARYFPQLYDVSKSVKLASDKIENSTIKAGNTTLAVMLLFSFGFSRAHRVRSLHCSLQKIVDNIIPNTPTHIFVWVHDLENQIMPFWWKEFEQFVTIMPIDPLSWALPSFLGSNNNWVHTDIQYCAMGRWRQTFAFDFVRAMNYSYMLQIDDDTYIDRIIDFNMISTFNERNIFLSVWEEGTKDIIKVTLGLPEFTRYFMTTRNYLSPVGPLFKHCKPPDISGLVTGGWDLQTYRGGFLVWKVDFWYTDIVQEYLTVIWRTGSDVEQRWQEQAVMQFVRLLFVPEKNMFVFPLNMMHHKRQPPNFCKVLSLPILPVESRTSLRIQS